MPLARGHCGGGARYAFFKVLALRLCIANGLAAGLPCMVYSAARLVPGLCNNTGRAVDGLPGWRALLVRIQPRDVDAAHKGPYYRGCGCVL